MILTSMGFSYLLILIILSSNKVLVLLVVLSIIAIIGSAYILLNKLTNARSQRDQLDMANHKLVLEMNKRTAELAEANSALQARNQELEQAYQELARAETQVIHREKMASLGVLVAGVAHELNNPISFLYSNIEFIEDFTERLVQIVDTCQNGNRMDEAQQARYRRTVSTLRELMTSSKEGTERIKKIVLDLQTFSRTDDIGLLMMDIHSGIESTLRILGKEYADRITIHRNYGDLPLVECHPGQINQVFMNILLNAAQAIAKVGDIWIDTAYQAPWVNVTIRDNGAGIPTALLPRIFDPFFTSKPVGVGMGLGLSICDSIIKKHGGQIKVNSQVGEGTMFIVELPLNREGVVENEKTP